jgi:hypothetical protein
VVAARAQAQALEHGTGALAPTASEPALELLEAVADEQ